MTNDKMSWRGLSLQKGGSGPFVGYQAKIDTSFGDLKLTKELSGANRYGMEHKFPHKGGINSYVETSIRVEKGKPGWFIGWFVGY